MIVIVEGPDGAGKSTLIGHLERRFNKQGRSTYRVHHGPYAGATPNQVVKRYISSLKFHHGVTFLDRSWLSEPIYGRVMRGGINRISPVWQRFLERMATYGRPAVVVKLVASFEDCAAAYKARKALEYLPDEHLLRQVYDAYAAPLATSLLTIEARRGEQDEAFHALKGLVDISYPATMAGLHHMKDQVLLVGDRSNYRGNARQLKTPFVSFNKSGCSYWLGEQLERHGLTEERLAWGNVNDRMDDQQFLENDFNCFREVIALGGEADLLLGRAGVRHLAVPHPQYWKRFKAGSQYPLIPLLKELLHDT